MVPADEPLIELLLGDVELVLGDVELDDDVVSVLLDDELLLPVVPEVVPDIELDPELLPIIALVSVHAPALPCRQPVSVMVLEEPVALWSQLPDVPVLLGDEVAGSCVGVVLEPDCAARVTANAQAMATLDAVVTTRFIW